jgi:molybdopterin converting factor small subunit
MAVVMLRAPLKDRADGLSQVELPGGSIGQVLRELERRYPRLEGWILDEHGRIRRHVNVFVDGERGTAETPTDGATRVHVLPSISGGGSR